MKIDVEIKDHDNKGYAIIAVDFDGTLCRSAYPEIGGANKDLIEFLKMQRENGNKVILWTARTDAKLEEAVQWCRNRGLEFDRVNEGDPVVEEMYGIPGKPTRKIYADMYIDDRNFAAEEIWSEEQFVEAVYKPEHYQNGEFEVIDEMVIMFGVEATIEYCRINAWKYRARCAYKGKQEEDMQKSDEYLKMAYELQKRRQAQIPAKWLDPRDVTILIGDRD